MDFEENTSRTAVNGRKNSICSKEKNCGTSHYSDSSETSTSEECGSFTITMFKEQETKEWILREKKRINDIYTKGGKTLPKKKPQQKTTFTTDHTINAQEKNNIACRVLSARDHEIKELKNEVAVLQNKLETFATENIMLKRLQYQHLKVIRNYENAEIKLPDLLTTHSKEMQALKAHLQKSQEEERRASKKLRDVEVQLLKTKDALQALKKLCEDKKLEERGELQRKLTSLTQKLEASDKRTQDLEKQLSLKTASFRHQLAVEKKKTIEAQSTTANLQVEMESLKLKLKEKERELGITNIYAHRMHKVLDLLSRRNTEPRLNLISLAVKARPELSDLDAARTSLIRKAPKNKPSSVFLTLKSPVVSEKPLDLAIKVKPASLPRIVRAVNPRCLLSAQNSSRCSTGAGHSCSYPLR
ncbi:lebercilin-like protein [Erythrolamprus reginae]|uniref:lebercilin-like protein n=1 Tax=Erythrolamprus reginae TaxID=121349 RepID=UPI00396C77E7